MRNKGSKKLKQSLHNQQTGKYKRQKVRTAKNKAKRIEKQVRIREVKVKKEQLKVAFL